MFDYLGFFTEPPNGMLGQTWDPTWFVHSEILLDWGESVEGKAQAEIAELEAIRNLPAYSEEGRE